MYYLRIYSKDKWTDEVLNLVPADDSYLTYDVAYQALMQKLSELNGSNSPHNKFYFTGFISDHWAGNVLNISI